MSEQKLADKFLKYPQRKYGMDHDHYDWSQLSERDPVAWPNGKKLALWINVPIQFFPLNQRGEPFKVPGGMTMPYPDLRHFSLREYGNRIGIYRLIQAFEQFDIKPTYAINSDAAKRLPQLMNEIKERGEDVICHGINMDCLHHNGLSVDQEMQQILESKQTLNELFDRQIKGWLSPAKNQSSNTLNLLSEAGFEFVCDWVNDELPYKMRTNKGSLTAMPLATELDDYFVVQQNFHSEESWVQQVCDATDFLLKEATADNGRMLSLNIHPWLMGQPHRIGYLEEVLELLSNNKDIWHASASQICEHWQTNESLKK